MTQLTLGLDRDSALVAASFDERDPAVLAMLERGISSVSLNPDTVVDTWLFMANNNNAQ